MARRGPFHEVAPIFPVADVAAALRHYATLGFRTRPYEDGADYGFAERGPVSIHLTFRATSYYAEKGVAVAYLFVRDADLVYEEWTRPGVLGRTEPPRDMPWNMHEGIHVDPDGNLIRYGSPLR